VTVVLIVIRFCITSSRLSIVPTREMFPKQAVEASCRTSRPFVLRQLGLVLCAQVSGLARSAGVCSSSAVVYQ
jgi:hypothetical protein